MRALANADEKIDAHNYPATNEELTDAYGDIELELPNGDGATLGDALDSLGETTFEDAEDARLAAYSAMPKDAVGRQNYSDRDSPSIGEDGPEQLSF
ncbi:MAG: DUF2795 domain-containing protein [Natronomonas sp.]